MLAENLQKVHFGLLIKYLTSDEQKETALKILETSDVIINRARTINISIEEQYLQSQPPEYWNLFKQAIVQVNPLYEKHMSWFTKPGHNTISYEGVYIMRKDLYQNLVREYFQIMEYIWGTIFLKIKGANALNIFSIVLSYGCGINKQGMM